MDDFSLLARSWLSRAQMEKTGYCFFTSQTDNRIELSIFIETLWKQVREGREDMGRSNLAARILA